MKRVALAILIAGAVCSAAFSQQFDNPAALSRFGLTEPEIEQVTQIWIETEREIQTAQLELNILKAQLEKLLFPANVDLNAVEKVLRDSAEWKVKSELAVIRRRVLIRQVFGEDRWARFLRAQRQARLREEAEQPGSTEERSPSGQ